jgi:hypothetical protein
MNAPVGSDGIHASGSGTGSGGSSATGHGNPTSGTGTPAGAGGSYTPPPIMPMSGQGDAGCTLKAAAFCETFDAPSPGGNGGDIDDSRWSVARIASGNFEQGGLNAVGFTTTVGCGRTVGTLGAVETPQGAGVLPPNDFFICSGGGTSSSHLGMSLDDHGGFQILSFRARQPFDFAGRTGIIAFDLDAQGAIPGGHGFWFNVFIARDPVPAPYQDGNGTNLYTTAGVGIEFEEGYAGCDGMGLSNAVSRFFTEKDYAITSQVKADNPTCFKTAPPTSELRTTYIEKLNHVEIHISETSIQVFASDVDQPADTMRVVASIDTTSHPEFFPLPLTRGYVSFQQTHYNARKFTFTDPTCTDKYCTEGEMPAASCTKICPVAPSYHTYHWDNIAFDGPVFSAPRGYELPDTLWVDQGHPEDGASTGWELRPVGWQYQDYPALYASPISLPNVDLTGALDALLTMNVWFPGTPNDTISYRFNGGTWRTFTPPIDTSITGAMTFAMPVPLADLKQGTNTVEMKSNDDLGIVVANVELQVDVP